MTAFGTVEGAVAAMKDGAYDFITKPVKRHAIVKSVRQALERASLWRRTAPCAPAWRALRGAGRGRAGGHRPDLPRRARHAAAGGARPRRPSSSSGRAAPARSSRPACSTTSPRAPSAPFVPVNCAAIPETILESELFGYERGAFTGATQRKEGRFQRAHGGTLFLDEVGDMSPGVQAKLLRVLQDGVVERLGGTQPVQVDVRIVAATNRELAAEVRAGRFREDLFYRLDVVTVRLPALRERREDVPLLAASFLRAFAERNRRPVTGFTDAALSALAGYDWPGQRARAAARHRARRGPLPGRRGGARATCPTPVRAAGSREGERRRRAPSPSRSAPRSRRWSGSSSGRPCATRAGTRTSPPGCSGSPPAPSTGSSTGTRTGASSTPLPRTSRARNGPDILASRPPAGRGFCQIGRRPLRASDVGCD